MATSASSISGGSTLDVQTLASQLVAAERAPLDAQIKRETAGVKTTLSALGTLKSALSTFQAVVDNMSMLADFQVRSAMSSKPEVFSASAGSGAVPGTYGIEVRQLAAAHSIASGAYAGGSAALVGSGRVALSVGDSAFSIDVTADMTLAQMRDAVNNAQGNTGVSATIVQSTAGARLVLAARDTGAANTLTVSVANAAGGLDSLAYTSAAPGSYTQLTAAQDAIVRVAGFEQTSASNTITGAIDGVTLNLAAADVGMAHTLTIANDTDTVRKRIDAFVSTYNAMQTAISGLRAYNATTKEGGPLLGDSMLLGLESRLRRGLTDAVAGLSGNHTSLAALGITTGANGNLIVDDTKLSAAIEGDFEGVARLFGKTGGVGFRLQDALDDALSMNGGIAVRTRALLEQQDRLADRQDVVDARMQSQLARYVRQFTTLDTLLSTLDTTSAYLDTQLDSLSNMMKRGK
ncbi:MAG TPA: flagellar filament capping protein FliD [Steroidobacteraceae bacterium]|nr:flagellar filament capping protein FliD [Steroidobacteraceae bacterium]HQX77752.1 flagellar filament capping protein FliD [Steroidobacteraceae bacterium]HQZ79670.1 flagellar filament capping protein FliD [Steroidobacteraceae bacterium]